MDAPSESIDSDVVEGELATESTVPELAPPRRSTPVVLPAPRRSDRSRRSTLVSPIPGLMAARMRDDGEVDALAQADAVPIHTSSAQTTARQVAPADAEPARDGDPDYVVEIDASAKQPR